MPGARDQQADLFAAPPAVPDPVPHRPPAPTWDLRLGRWQDVLGDVTCDVLTVDAPYSPRTHARQQYARRDDVADDAVTRRGLGYDAMTDADVRAFVASWSPRTRGWFCSITDSELYPAWRDALRAAGRYVFAPIPCVQTGSNVRLRGDGPSSWTCWLVVARGPSGYKAGTLPGAYIGTPEARQGSERIPGAKPVWLMQAIVRDYSAPGDVVCDPCAGSGTTLLAARAEGRSAIGAEALPAHHAIAMRRLSRRYTPPLFPDVDPAPQ